MKSDEPRPEMPPEPEGQDRDRGPGDGPSADPDRSEGATPDQPQTPAPAPETGPAPEAVDEEPPEEPKRRRPWRRAAIIAVLVPAALYLLCVMGLVYVRYFPPVTTGVQIQRSIEGMLDGEETERDYRWRPMDEISRYVPRAVVAAEDGGFYQHNGFDWAELEIAREEAERTGEPMRGASTITQQLVKNLFFTTHRNAVRKVFEWGLTPPAEWILGKDRIIELYVNVVEFGPGIYGVEAAAQHYFGMPASRLSRHQAASLAAVLPAPLRRRPQAMDWYTSIIEERMARMGW